MRALIRARGMPRAALSHDQVGPDLGLGKDRQIGLPMLEKASHIARHIQGGVLMDRAGPEHAAAPARRTSRFRS